jgi:hypothetical protein
MILKETAVLCFELGSLPRRLPADTEEDHDKLPLKLVYVLGFEARAFCRLLSESSLKLFSVCNPVNIPRSLCSS